MIYSYVLARDDFTSERVDRGNNAGGNRAHVSTVRTTAHSRHIQRERAADRLHEFVRLG